MSGITLRLDITGWPCVVIGGGAVAARRVRALVEAGADSVVIAPEVMPEIDQLGVRVVRRPYQDGDVSGARLVVIATDDESLNDTIASAARAAGAMVNRCDRADLGDVRFPVTATAGPITVSVDTDGVSAAAAVRIRDELADALDPDWARLLDAAAPYREKVRQTTPPGPDRQDMLRRLTSDDAMAILKRDGTDALARHLDALVADLD